MPSLDTLDVAMLRPARSVPAIHRLGGGTVLLAAADQPWRVVGQSAAVYQLRQPGGRLVALRCPLADEPDRVPGLEARYQALSSAPTLAPLRANGGPLVENFSFFAQGLTLPAGDFRSAPHPLIAMDWVVGPTLLAAVDHAARGGDRATLETLAEAWAAAVGALAGTGFVHGELTADNALVRPGGGLVLVDYDASAWPGSPDPPTPDAAAADARHAAYVHPRGDAAPGDQRDRFPALVVYASLRFLALWPELRERYVAPSERDSRLLFDAADLERPDNSPLFAELSRLDDVAGRELAEVLRDACLAPVTATPALADVIGDLRRTARRTGGQPLRQPEQVWADHHSQEEPSTTWPTASDRGRPPRSAPVPAWTGSADETAATGEGMERQRRLTRLNSLLLFGDEPAALRFWRESGLDQDLEAARELGRRIAEIERRLAGHGRDAANDPRREAVAGRRDGGERGAPGIASPGAEPPGRRRELAERLRDALTRGDERAVLRLWPDLRGDPLVSDLAIRAQRVLATTAEAAVAAAISDGEDDDIVASVAEAAENGVAVGAAARRAARGAADRMATRRALRAAVADDDRPALAALALSGRLGEIGRLEQAEMRAALRALAWPHLERALAADDDAAILAASDDELFADETALTPEQRARVDLARGRIAWLAETRSALRRRDVAALRAALIEPPPEAQARLSRVERGRLERLTIREEATERLATALRDGPDTAVLSALKQVEAAGAALPAALDWAAVRGVVDRVTLANTIREAAAADPPDYARLARLLPAARAAMVETGRGLGADIDFGRLERDVLRAAHLGRLRDALASDDAAAIAAASDPDPFDALSRLSAVERDRVEHAQRLRGRRVSSSGERD